MNRRNFGIYIHWPFCRSKCPYCDFFSQVKKDIPQEKIIEDYIKELDFYHDLTSTEQVSSIFFGGGTPSLIKPQLIAHLIEEIEKKWSLKEDIEISLEANPNTDSQTLFSDLKSAGINRLSLGVQALNDKDLKFLGRTHNAAQAQTAIEKVLKTFDNHSMDLIYARPEQKLEAWQQELSQAVGFGFKHLSLYQLTIEEGTNFAKRGIKALEENAAAEMYDFTTDFLAKHGYPRYEVSNFATPQYQCRHNLLYWQGDNYIGIGQGAHGRIKTTENKIYATTYRCQLEELSQEERAEELLLMGLRLDMGINKKNFKKLCGKDFSNITDSQKIKELEKLGFIQDNQDTVRLTKTGLPLMNHILSEIVI